MVPGKLHRWKIGFASSTALGSLHKTGSVELSAAQAFVHAAGNLGLKTSLVNVRAQKVSRGWTNLRVGGLRDIQRVRLGSFGLGRVAIPGLRGDRARPVRPTLAFRTIVNARTGAILARTNLTDNFATSRSQAHQRECRRSRSTARSPRPTARATSARARSRRPGVRALTGFAAATLSSNDVVFNLFFDGARRR
jgi:hypothetical protein